MARLAVVLLLLLLLMASCCLARDFYVGGQDGWATKPAEPYNHWAERNRFLVNDRLVFRYRKDEDSVLVVSPSHYDACNNTEPYLRLDGGDSVFVLGHSGPLFFISGDRQRCQDGERLIIVVLAERQKGGAPPDRPSPPPPPPSQSPPPPAPPVPAPAPRHMPPPPPPSNSSSPSSAPAQAPPAVEAPLPGKNGTSSASSVLSSGVLAYVVASGAIILVEAFLG